MSLKSRCILPLFLYLPAANALEANYPWLDSLHQDLSQSVDETAQWFDTFFETEDNQSSSATGTAKIRLGYTPRATQLGQTESRIRVQAKLPRLQKQLDLIFSDYDEQQEESVTESAIREARQQDNESFNVALRWIHKDTKTSRFDTRLGLSGGGDPYLRFKNRQLVELSSVSNVIFRPSLSYYLDKGMGAKFLFDWQVSFSQDSMWQLSNGWEHVQDRDDAEWQHSLLNYYQIDEKHALISGVFFNGQITTGYHVENRGIFSRYRWQSERTWLYFEVEPFLHWPELRDYDFTPGIAFRVEGKFGG